MPEKGWKKLTVRKLTTEEIKAKAQGEGLTIDEYLMKVIRRAERTYEKCSICVLNVPKEDFNFHLQNHVKENPSMFVIRKSGRCVCGGQKLTIRLKTAPDGVVHVVHSHTLKKVRG